MKLFAIDVRVLGAMVCVLGALLVFVRLGGWNLIETDLGTFELIGVAAFITLAAVAFTVAATTAASLAAAIVAGLVAVCGIGFIAAVGAAAPGDEDAAAFFSVAPFAALAMVVLVAAISFCQYVEKTNLPIMRVWIPLIIGVFIIFGVTLSTFLFIA